jgi:hypothetical protein
VPAWDELGVRAQHGPKPDIAASTATLVAGNALLLAADERPNLVALDAAASRFSLRLSPFGQRPMPEISPNIGFESEIAKAIVVRQWERPGPVGDL